MSLRLEHADPNDPVEMSLGERRDELANIFARAILRIPRRGCDAEQLEEIAAESAPLGLELSALPCPDRDRG